MDRKRTYLALISLILLTFSLIVLGLSEGQNGTTLVADLNATATWQREYSWTIDKSVTPDSWHLFKGDQGTSNYTITITKDLVSNGSIISGVINVYNGGEVTTEGLNITVNLTMPPSSTIIASSLVDLSSNPDLDPYEMGYYYYEIHVPEAYVSGGDTYKVTAVVTITNHSGYLDEPFGPSPSATTVMPEEYTIIDSEIDVDDTNGQSWSFSDSGSVTYLKTFTCCDAGTNNNTATMYKKGTDEVLGQDSATVTVNCYNLTVTKTAETSFTRTYNWTIEKVGNVTYYRLMIGETAGVSYNVTVDASYTDSDWKVVGQISVHNPAPIAANITSITDIISPDIAADVDFGVTFPYTLAAGATLSGTYNATLPDATCRTNTATVTLQNYNYDYELVATPIGTTGFCGNATVSFSGATMTEIDESIEVSDTYEGFSNKTVTIGIDTLPKKWSYTRTVGPYESAGFYYVNNTACFTTNDTGTIGCDDWSIIIEVPVPITEDYSIIGMKFFDVNVNGNFDGDDYPLEDWTIQLWNSTSLVATNTTNYLGMYEFTDIEAGTYWVKEVLPQFWYNTTPIEVMVNLNITYQSEIVNFGNVLVEIEVEKDAIPYFTRTYNWAIDKSVTPSTWHLFKGDSGNSTYTVTVTKTGYIDSNYIVSGYVTINNTSPSALIVNVTILDELYDGAVLVNSTNLTPLGPITLPQGVSVYPYTIGLSEYNSTGIYSNKVTVSIVYPITESYSYTEPFSFTTPTTLVYDSINVDDTNGGSWIFSNSGSVNYDKTFSCAGVYNNTATIRETSQNDNATVTVYIYELEVTKTVIDTNYTRTYNWNISKTAYPTHHDIFKGDTATSEYNVLVQSEGYMDSDWMVSGNITVKNNHPTEAANINLVDVKGGIDMNVTIPASSTYMVQWSYNAPSGVSGSNTATATLSEPQGGESWSDDVNFSFSGPTTEIYKTVTIKDTYEDTTLGTVTYPNKGNFTYSRDFTEERTYDNIASIYETGDSDDASVTVNVYELEVSKTVDETSLTRTYDWTISKYGNVTELELHVTETGAVEYTVVLDSTYVDSNWKVKGTITVYNPAPIAANITSITDVVSPSITASACFNVTFPYLLPAGGTLVGTYSADLPDANNRVNTVTVVMQNTPSGTTNYSANANVDFSSAIINLVDECVDVSDDLYGSLGKVCYNCSLPYQYIYDYTIGPYECAGDRNVTNVASFYTNDTNSTDSDNWIVDIRVWMKVSGHKYHDVDKSGTKTSDEPYLEGWTIVLSKYNRTTYVQVNSTTTNANGYYEFIIWEYGEYKISENLYGWWQAIDPPEGKYVFEPCGGDLNVEFGNYHPGTRTQGYWQTHWEKVDYYWPGMIKNATTDIDDTCEVLAGFWARIPFKSDGARRSSVNQARMILVQQLLAAKLNVAVFDIDHPDIPALFNDSMDAYYSGDIEQILQMAWELQFFNESGDWVPFPSDYTNSAANPKESKAIASSCISFWDYLP